MAVASVSVAPSITMPRGRQERPAGGHPEIRAFEARIASAPLPSGREIDLAHGFHDTPQGRRFTISPQARADVLDKLLALNHYRHQQELASGVLTKKKPRSKPKPAPPQCPRPG